MPKGFYYLIASLPFLSIEKELEISEKGFLEESEKWLSDQDRKKLLESVSFEKAQGNKEEDVVTKWKTFDNEIRTKLKIVREKRKEGLALGQADKDIQDIVNEESPFEKELLLAKKKLEALDDLEQGHIFDLEAVIIYYLKLVIIVRIKSFDKEKGTQVFEHLCEVKYEQN